MIVRVPACGKPVKTTLRWSRPGIFLGIERLDLSTSNLRTV